MEVRCRTGGSEIEPSVATVRIRVMTGELSRSAVLGKSASKASSSCRIHAVDGSSWVMVGGTQRDRTRRHAEGEEVILSKGVGIRELGGVKG